MERKPGSAIVLSLSTFIKQQKALDNQKVVLYSYKQYGRTIGPVAGCLEAGRASSESKDRLEGEI
jgi:hypothetical protein